MVNPFTRITRSFTRRNRADQPGPSQPQQHQPQQPNPTVVDRDSDPDNEDSHYDPHAAPYERKYGFNIPTRRMFKKLLQLEKRKFENTRLVDIETLEQLGIAEDFFDLTKEVGFERKFWEISDKCYKVLTMEFLSSFQFKYNYRECYPYIKFRLCNEGHWMLLNQFREIMGFEFSPDFELPFYREGWKKINFWQALTGLQDTKGYKVRFIQHPTFRIMHRILGSTIFARGETVTRISDRECQLMDMMLLENPIKPDLAFLLAQHWEDIRDQPKSGGAITIGAYVTHLAIHMGFDLAGYTECTGPSRITPRYLESAKFLKVQGPNSFLWLMEGRASFLLPYTADILAYDQSTWTVPLNHAGPNVGAPIETHEDDMGPNLAFTAGTSRARASTSAAHPSTSRAQPSTSRGRASTSHQPDTQYPDLSGSITQLNNLSLSLRHEVREARRLSEHNSQRLDHLHQRVDDLLQTQYDEQWYNQYGYYQGAEDDPNLYGGPFY